MNSIWSKIWFDVSQQKARTIQIVLIIALGAVGIGLVLGGRNLIIKSISESWQKAGPPSIFVSVVPGIDDQDLNRIEKINGINQAEGLYEGRLEWRTDKSQEWQDSALRSRADYNDQLMSKDEVIEGRLPERNEIAIGRLSFGEPTLKIGDQIQVRFDDSFKEFDVVGIIDPISPQPSLELPFFVQKETFEDITGDDEYSILQTRDLVYNEDVAKAADIEIQEYLDTQSIDSFGILFPFQNRILPPETPPAKAILDSVFLILGVIGVVIVFLGTLLVYNSINAIVSEQIDEIGIMKAVGASSYDVIFVYLCFVLILGLMAAIIAIPAGSIMAIWLERFFAQFLNINSIDPTIDRSAIWVQLVICFVVPIVSAMVPIIKALKISVREAISSYGLFASANFIGRLITKLNGIWYTFVLIIGNTFRNLGRVGIIQISLILAGSIFMMVNGVQDSADFTFIDKIFEVHNYDISIGFEELQNQSKIEKIAENKEGVIGVESIYVGSGTVREAMQNEKEVEDTRVQIVGHDVTSPYYVPVVLEGRALSSGDEDVVLLASRVANQKGWKVGQEITVEDNKGREIEAEVVGIISDPSIESFVYFPLEFLEQEVNVEGLRNGLLIRTQETTENEIVAREIELREGLETRIGDVSDRPDFASRTVFEQSSDKVDRFVIIVTLLSVMAVVIAIVGGVGLSGVLSLNILERKREIGVMRAIGASDFQIVKIFVGEGVMLGILSWMVSLPLSIPLAYFFTTQLLANTFNETFFYAFTLRGPLIWLFLIILLSMVASITPAISAAKVSVRESLSY